MASALAFVWPEHVAKRSHLCRLFLSIFKAIPDSIPLYLVYGRETPPSVSWMRQMTGRVCGRLLPVPKINDIWIRDWAPIWINDAKGSRYVKTRYFPDYLTGREAKVDDEAGVSLLRRLTRTRTRQNELRLDGGVFINNGHGLGLATERALRHFGRKSLGQVERLADLFEVDRLIVIPEEPGDETGHIDGVVRFLDAKTVTVARYDYSTARQAFASERREAAAFTDHLALDLERTLGSDFRILRIPHDFCIERGRELPSASGIRSNFIQCGKFILLPGYRTHQDDLALKAFPRSFEVQLFDDPELRKLSELGGVLNCVSWSFDDSHLDSACG